MSCKHPHEPLNALLDGELPPAEAAALSAHLAACPDCRLTLRELAELRAAIAELERAEVPAALEARIRALTDAAPAKILPFRPRWRQFGLLAATAGLAAALTLAVLPKDRTADFMAVRDAALRGGLTQLADAGAPTVPGFTLTGTRRDEVAGHHAQIAVYTRNGVRFILCIWPAGREPARGLESTVYRGMAISYWNDGHEEYWVASKMPAPALPGFVQALRAGSTPDAG
jgi:anti-sigma factor RsiW